VGKIGDVGKTESKKDFVVIAERELSPARLAALAILAS
jgi:hypothetical protein